MKRYDSAPLSKVERTPQGGLKIQGNLTKTGVFAYKQPDGSMRKEFRPDSEVFTTEHLSSFKGAPITIGHPGLVTSANWKEHAVGHIGEDVHQDGNFAVGTLYVQDGDAVKAIEGGKLRELSCGYDVDLDETPGEHNGERYDAIQRNIRGNHVAMGPEGWGRAGRDVAMRLDSAGNEISNYTENTMPEATPQAVPAPVAPATVNAAEVNIRVDGQKEIDRLSGENQMLTARVAELEAQVKDTSRLDALVEERVALITTAKEIVKDLDPKGKSNRDLKTAVIVAKNPKFKMDAKASDDFVNAAYQMALSFEAPAEAPHASLGALRADAHNAAPAVDAVTSAAQKNVQHGLDAWKTSNRDTLLGRGN